MKKNNFLSYETFYQIWPFKVLENFASPNESQTIKILGDERFSNFFIFVQTVQIKWMFQRIYYIFLHL